VKWSIDGERFVHSAEDATSFVRELFAQHGERVADLEVRRATLEDTYLAMVQRYETRPGDTADEAPAHEAAFGGAA
jgi:ABC-2 type transport system ATP-binding protein